MPDLLVDGRDALLVDPGNGNQLTAAIERVLTDHGLAERLSTAGRAFAARNTLEVHRARILDALRRRRPSRSRRSDEDGTDHVWPVRTSRALRCRAGRAAVGTAAPPRTRRARSGRRRRLAPGLPATVDPRPESGRIAADVDARPPLLPRLQRRDLQRARVAARARGHRDPLPGQLGHRGAAPPAHPARHRRPGPAQRHVRVRARRHRRAAGRARPRPAGQEAALLRVRAGRLPVRVRAEGAARLGRCRHRARRGRPRRLPRHRLGVGRAVHLPRLPQAAARPRADSRPRRAGAAHLTLVAAGAGRLDRPRRGQPSDHRRPARRTRGVAGGRGPHPAPQRRPGRHLPVRRHRQRSGDHPRSAGPPPPRDRWPSRWRCPARTRTR